ncbi:hypothetical protein PPTG_10435 [Phytophthora nicotianae INRA-310]|uniref:Uncharacterized protein n=1 Tax=Phytophthora nicotianae (strain INRA-310) TaxID=761204 RepID=W2QH38_PHYN3|nr:hypothetical protein PPTG_10435 [Phytophthora nicotianae INRA-310]ETN11600.1 hypothetical protein PPTG_10435 [Phytophthora nicotianae INRA-310]
MNPSSWETLDNEFDTEDQALGTTVMLAEDDGSLSKQIIVDYFTSDGPRTRRLDSSDEPERNILDESSGDEELRESREIPERLDKVHGMKTSSPEKVKGERTNASVDLLEERRHWVVEALFTWEIVQSVLVVLVALAQYMWMWNLVELSTLGLESGH